MVMFNSYVTKLPEGKWWILNCHILPEEQKKPKEQTIPSIPIRYSTHSPPGLSDAAAFFRMVFSVEISVGRSALGPWRRAHQG